MSSICRYAWKYPAIFHPHPENVAEKYVTPTCTRPRSPFHQLQVSIGDKGATTPAPRTAFPSVYPTDCVWRRCGIRGRVPIYSGIAGRVRSGPRLQQSSLRAGHRRFRDRLRIHGENRHRRDSGRSAASTRGTALLMLALVGARCVSSFRKIYLAREEHIDSSLERLSSAIGSGVISK